MTAIVIPAANTRPVCSPMLEDLMESICEDESYEDWTIIVCFDNCGKRFVRHFTEKYSFIIPITNTQRNVGFAENANRGLKMAYEVFKEDAFVLNMDTILPPAIYMEALKNGGLSSPNPVHLKDTKNRQSLLALQPDIVDGKVQTKARDEIKFPGFCMYFSKELMEKCGYLDAGFIATFEDDDICLRANLAGLPVQVFDIYVHHYTKDRTEMSTTGAYDHMRMNSAKIRFMLKWNVPAHVPHEKFNEYVLRVGSFPELDFIPDSDVDFEDSPKHKWLDEMRFSK